MARLQGYTLDSTLTNEDLVIGSSYDANTGKYTTNNFKLGTLTNFFNQGITSAQLADNAVTAAELNISGNGTSGQCIISDGDGSFSYLTLNHDNLTGFVANEHIDWTTDQGSTNIHAGNYTNTTYSAMGSGNSYAAGLVLAGGSSHGGAFLRKDGTWQVPPDTIYTLPTATDSVKGGVTTGYTTNAKNYQVQSSGTDIYVNVPWTDTTYTAFAGSTSPGTAALVPARDSGATTTKYLREDGDWVVPPDTTTNTFRTVKVDTTNDGTANETIGATEDLQLVGGTAIVLSESAGVVTITGPVESYTAHENISAATSVDNSGRTYIQDITLDSNGHVTGLTSATETITDSFPAWIVRDDDNDDNTLSGSTNIYLKFAAATGTLGTNLTGAGSSGDPYVMTITSPNDNDNTFRTVKVDTDGDGTADNTLTATEDLMLKKGSNITLAEADGVVTISSTDTNTNQLTTFVVEDGDGTEVTISQDKEWKFVEGTGIDIDWTNVSNGTDADPYDLTFTVDLEGTELKSTGETGGTKFLREDGDGTCSWQTIDDYTLPIATASALGGVKVGTNLSIDSTTGVLSAGPIALTTVQTAANQAAQLALTCQEGDVVVRTDENKTYMHNGGTASDMNDFTELSSPGNVSSVNTTDGTYINLTPNSATTGAITVTADLSAADGTADTSTRFLSKDNTWDVPAYTSTYTLPIATASALGGIKIGAGLSIDASSGEVTGLEIGTSGSTAMAGNTSIPSGNAIIDWTGSGAGTIHASNYTNTTYSEATSSDAGLMSTTHHDKLDGIAAGAEVNVQSDWNSSSGDNQILNKPTIPSGNQIIDWTATHAEVIHSDNYTNTTYSVGDGGLTENNLTNALKSSYDAAYTHSQAAHAPAGAEANVQSDWNASSGDAKILNKPTIIAVGSGSGDAMAGDTRTISASEVTKLGHIAVTQAVDLDDIETKAGNGNTAHGWGNHASAGYLTSFSEADTLATATGRGATTSTACSFTNTTSFLIGGSGEANLYLGNIISASSSDKGARFHSNNNDFYMDFQGDATQNWFLRDYDGSGGTHDRFGFNFINGTFTATGDVVAYGTPSDIKWKENIKPIEDALDKVTKLEGVTFDWKEDSDTYSMVGIKEDIGFIAQDVKKVIPEIVRENNSGDLSLRMNAVIPVLVQAIKELKEEINELKEKCNGCTC